MKMTVVPAQVTTVEDRIIGTLGFSQILLLVIPVFTSAGIFAIVPPFLSGALYKYIVIAVVAVVFCILAIRIKGKIIAFWLVTILRYNLRPKYYLFNKNVTIHREDYPARHTASTSEDVAVRKQVTKPNISPLDIPTTAKLLATLDNPATKFRLETGKKGQLYVRFTEIED